MKKMVFSGFGGQGVLTLGQIVANIGMHQGKEVTWMPSYGAEMRGGTANCAVITSDTIIGSPIVQSGIDILCALNQPSLDKFLPRVKPGGLVLVNSSIVKDKVARDDVTVVEVDATNIAVGLGNIKVQNMVMLAGILKSTDIMTKEEVKVTLEQTLGVKNPKLVPLNLQAIDEGLEKIYI
jgi:2-oxoglutarate ferredoxin oxidoreductase subunit gamma